MNTSARYDSFKSKRIKKRGIILRFLDLVVSIASIVAIALFFNLTYFSAFESNLIVWIITYVVYFLLFAEIFEMYQFNKTHDFYFLIRSVLFTSLLITLAYIVTPLITPVLPTSRFEVLVFFQSVFWPLLLWRLLYNQLFFHPVFLKKIVIIGNSDEVEKLIELTNQYSSEYSIVGYLTLSKIPSINPAIKWFNLNQTSLEAVVRAEKVQTVVICGKAIKQSFQVYSQEILKIFQQGVVVISNNEFIEQLTKRIAKSRLNDSFYDYFSYSKYHTDSVYVNFIRFFDIVTSLIGLLFLALIIPIVVFINVFFNKGSLFYSQERVGRNGVVYHIYKLRTMIEGAEKGLPLWATKGDLRITPFGNVLRKTRVDELPQFYNVLKGDMRVIGPRPERPEFVSLLEKELPYYGIRHIIKPGLTGWAQVKYPYANTVEDQEMKLRYDLYYLRERSLLLDLKIILKTINTILFYKGY